MARPLRFQYPGATYHVMARGDGGKAVFDTDDDRKAFVFRLGQVYVWVLMGNHIFVQRADGRSRTRPGMREHGEKEAERIVGNGMKTLGGSPGAASLAAMRKSDERKILLACLLRERTSVSNEWIATRLSMGHPGSVSRMVSAACTDKHLKGNSSDTNFAARSFTSFQMMT